MIVHYHTQRGLAHSLSGTPCQDSIAIAGGGSRGVYALALADGASNYARTLEGGKILAKRAAKLMAIGFDTFMNTAQEATILKRFRDLIQTTLIELHRRFPGEKNTAFASTLMVCGFMPSTGAYIAVQLGDGAVIVKDRQGVHRAIFPHENGNYSYLTTSPLEDLKAQMKLSRGQAESVMLTSDGAADFLYSEGGDVTPWSSWLIETARYFAAPAFRARLRELLDNDGRYIVDDFSVGLLSRGVPQMLPMEKPKKAAHFKKMRRVARAYNKYSLARESGLSALRAARKAGWGRRNRNEKMMKAEELSLWKTASENC